MTCPSCQHANRPGAKFCEECATPLTRTCAQCGNQVSPTARFCPECAHPVSGAAVGQPRIATPESYTPKHLAEKILTSRAALEGERKQVTVLFADLKGSMELLADCDPEEARKLLDPVLEHMMEAVHRYEGTVNQVMGDGIMALFGAPLAHEDHAVRACYAALRMQQAVQQHADGVRRRHGLTVQIRVGLNSGDVLVRAIGSDLRMDYTAVGQTTHLAARMEQLADPGAIVLSPATLELVEGYVEVNRLGPRAVKGLAEPMEVYALVGAGAVRSRLQAATARGLTRFVGRDGEREQLDQALERAQAGHGQVVAVVGDPGVGKSRLVYEVTHSPRTDGWLVLESASVSYGQAMSYRPVIELLKGYFTLQDRDALGEIRDKVTDKLLARDASLQPALPALLALLDVPVDDTTWHTLEPAQRRQRTLDAVKRLLLREAREHPLLLLVEDLHWIDAETQAVLDSLIESLPGARLLLLVTYRREYQHGWGQKSYYTQLRLDPLPPAGADELLHVLLGDHPSLAPLTRLLIERAEGNPFFLEEGVRALVETRVLGGGRGQYYLAQDVPTLQIPATVQAVLAARIDRLPPAERHLLQMAAVIGVDIPFALLRDIAGLPEEAVSAGLARLQATEFLYEANFFPELEYVFTHALTHEVAYGSLPQARRRAVHARIVEAIETLHRDRLGERIERLAHHAVRGELREKAVDYLRQAGGKAAARSALLDARAWFEQALGVLEALPGSASTLEQGFEIRLELRPVLAQLGEPRRMLERLREAETLAEKLNDDRRRGRVCALMTNPHSLLGELDEALVTGTRALEIAGRLGDLRLRIVTTSLLEQAHYLRGEYERVVELATENLAALPADWIYEHFGNAAPASVYDRVQLVMSLAQLGRFAEAAENAAEAIRLSEPTHHAYTVSQAHRAAGTLHLHKGDWAKAHLLIEHWIAVLRARNVVLQLPIAVACSAWVLAQLGEASEALNRLWEGEQLLERAAARGFNGCLSWAMLGRACLLLDRLDEAQRLGDRAVESSRSYPGFTAHELHLLGDIATHPDRFDAESGEAHYRKALALAEPRGMRPLIAHCHLGLGKLYRHTGKREQVRDYLITATTMYREMDMRFWLEQAEVELRRP
jgi:class 3 adenylate cyclase/tetratricopeptide (TPR) repeat protein